MSWEQGKPQLPAQRAGQSRIVGLGAGGAACPWFALSSCSLSFHFSSVPSRLIFPLPVHFPPMPQLFSLDLSFLLSFSLILPCFLSLPFHSPLFFLILPLNCPWSPSFYFCFSPFPSISLYFPFGLPVCFHFPSASPLSPLSLYSPSVSILSPSVSLLSPQFLPFLLFVPPFPSVSLTFPLILPGRSRPRPPLPSSSRNPRRSGARRSLRWNHIALAGLERCYLQCKWPREFLQCSGSHQPRPRPGGHRPGQNAAAGGGLVSTRPPCAAVLGTAAGSERGICI